MKGEWEDGGRMKGEWKEWRENGGGGPTNFS
jgi:hypothetical protein